ncbi:conserved hypothetical protein [Ricinus communis]|uniref:Uncharacterized protein n=1 Tax=Ricinus communis TaxID=3988 RepID=B9T6W3_RICCO|nr:conserved hypothetical protein [Ricinus communis]
MSVDENVGIHDDVGVEEHDDNEFGGPIGTASTFEGLSSIIPSSQMQKLTSSINIPSNMVPVDEVFSSWLGRHSSSIASPETHLVASLNSQRCRSIYDILGDLPLFGSQVRRFSKEKTIGTKEKNSA